MPVVPVPAGVATIPLEPLQLPGGEFGLPVAEPFPFPEKKAPLPLVVSVCKGEIAVFLSVTDDSGAFPKPNVLVNVINNKSSYIS